MVGGLARSFKWHGFDCDLAPHRFFTLDEELLRQVKALVPMRRIERRSGIRLRGRWLRDPVNIFEVLYKFMPSIGADRLGLCPSRAAARG